MNIRIDPSGNELRALLASAGSINGKAVLEIGCGDGRLTVSYARLAAHVTGIDPDPRRIERARQQLPADLHQRVEYLNLSLEQFIESQRTAYSQPVFDLGILSWSL